MLINWKKTQIFSRKFKDHYLSTDMFYLNIFRVTTQFRLGYIEIIIPPPSIYHFLSFISFDCVLTTMIPSPPPPPTTPHFIPSVTMFSRLWVIYYRNTPQGTLKSAGRVTAVALGHVTRHITYPTSAAVVWFQHLLSNVHFGQAPFISDTCDYCIV